MSTMPIELKCKAEIIPTESSAEIHKFPQNKNKGGRPSRYTAELADEICIAILEGDKGIARLCKENKHWPSKKTIFNWLKKNKEFQGKYKMAKEIQIDFLLDEFLELEQDALKWKIVHLQPRIY